MSEPDEVELLNRAQAGDRAAFGQLVRIHQRRLLGCAIQMLGDREAANDAVQEAFIRAYRAIERFDGRSELSTWLYRICVNVCLNAIRKRKRHRAADLSDPRLPEPEADPTQGSTDPALSVESAELNRRLAVALDSLSPSLRTTVVLVLVQGMAHKDAAEVLGCPEGTVAWRIHEARRKLREMMTDNPKAETPRAAPPAVPQEARGGSK